MSTFEQNSFNDVEVARGFVNMVCESNEYAGRVASRPSQICPPVSSWSYPSQGRVKVNCDAHLGVKTGLGAVIRNDQGTVVAAAVRQEGAGWDVGCAEAAACQCGLIVAKRLGYSDVQLESDALNVMNAVRNNAKGFSLVFLLCDDICRLSSNFSSFLISHVKRSGNTLAHNVARWETRGFDEFVSLGPFPQSLLTLAEIDLL